MLHSEFMDVGFYIMFFPIVFVYGICIGSFLNVVIYRLPRNESLVKRSSHCPKCGEKIRWYDNIPLISWLIILRGKCRGCHQPISKRYPIVEALNGIVYVITFAVLDFNLKTVLYCFFFSILICLGFIDWDTMEMDLPLLGLIVLLAVPLLVFGILPSETIWKLPEFFQFEDVSLVSHLIGGVCVSVPFFLIGELSGWCFRKFKGSDVRRGIELGDTLIMGAGGLMLGWKAAVMSAFMGIVLAAIGGLINKFRSGESKFAFGPFLAMGLFLGALFGASLMDWYIALVTYDPYA